MASLASGKPTSPVTEDISIGNGDDGIELDGKVNVAAELTEEEIEKQKKIAEYKEELTKIQEDIATLRLVLNDKMKRENELKTLMGVTFVDEMKQDLAEGFSQIKSSNAFQKAAQTFTGIGSTVAQNDAYQKTTAGLKTATQKITPAFQTLGGTMKSSLGNLRNTSMFKSFEAGLGSTFNTNKMKNSRSEFINDSESHGDNGIPTSRSTMGNLGGNTVNGVNKHDTILEDDK